MQSAHQNGWRCDLWRNEATERSADESGLHGRCRSGEYVLRMSIAGSLSDGRWKVGVWSEQTPAVVSRVRKTLGKEG